MSGLEWLRDESTPTAPTAEFAARVQKRAAVEDNRNLQAQERAAKARKKLLERVVKPNIQARRARDLDDLPRIPPGVALVREKDREAMDLARKLHFTCTNDPVEFVRKVVAGSAATSKGHLVLVPVSENSDFGICGRTAARLLGAYWADASDFVKKGRKCGIQYLKQWNNATSTYRIAVSVALAEEFPTLPALFQALAAASGSSFELYSERRLRKIYKSEVRKKPRISQHMCVLATESERDAAHEEVRPLYKLRVDFYSRFTQVRARAICPGIW
jgi:hypothetical protein